jgi:hypothetical protein
MIDAERERARLKVGSASQLLCLAPMPSLAHLNSILVLLFLLTGAAGGG